MSRDELSRLVGDVMANPGMMEVAMTINHKSAMESYISAQGYDLTKDELLEVWIMTAKVMAGHAQPMTEAHARIDRARGAQA